MKYAQSGLLWHERCPLALDGFGAGGGHPWAGGLYQRIQAVIVVAVGAVQQNPTGTLVADVTDLNPITFTIVNSGGDAAIPDVIVSGADSGNGTYLDIGTIIGRATPGDTIVMTLDVATTWNLTGPNAGTVTVQGYSGITFSAIDHLLGAAGADTFIFPDGAAFGGTLDGGSGAVNTLDDSADTTGVTVNLAAQTAAGTSGIGNIQTVIGGAGNDTLESGPGNDVPAGGPGDDTYVFDADGPLGTDTITESADGVRYTDVVTLTPVPLPGAVLLGLLGFGIAAVGLRHQRWTRAWGGAGVNPCLKL